MINVTNDGEVPLTNVWVWDPMLGMEWFVGDLDIGQYWVISVEYTIPLCYSDDALCNYAYANGTYHGVTIEWGDGWATWIFHDPCADPSIAGSIEGA